MKWTIRHCTSEPFTFFGRENELALLGRALTAGKPSVVAFTGPGGQGKTAILHEWLRHLENPDFSRGTQSGGAARSPLAANPAGGALDGVFFWSFYRGKESDACLRELYAAVAGLEDAGDASASYCVDHLLPLLRRQRWVVLLDGAEVVQHDAQRWFGRFLHPDLGRLLEELASLPQGGVTVLTTRFPLPELERRPYFQAVQLATMPADAARALLGNIGVRGSESELDAAAAAAGRHAKAVELLGTWLVRFHGGAAAKHELLPEVPFLADASHEERHVLRVLQAFQASLPQPTQDILALTTAFRDPPTEERLLAYLGSEPARALLHETWKRPYVPFVTRGRDWLQNELVDLVSLRLLERVRSGMAPAGREADSAAAAASMRHTVIDAHPLVRRGFEHVLGEAGRRQTAGARAGFLRARPDRQRAATLEDSREEVEMFHAYGDAGLWDEADRALAALDMPRYRFLAPAFERDLLLRFFPGGDRRQPPLWPGFGRYRALAVCLEMLGRFDEAIETYTAQDAPLRGDALIALGRLEPLLIDSPPPPMWGMLWQAYRCHALCLAGRVTAAVRLCQRLVPRDVYEWTHVFECLLRGRELSVLDMNSFLYRPPGDTGSRWNELGQQRMRADYERVTKSASPSGLRLTYEAVIEGYDRGGLPWERVLSRLGFARLLLAGQEWQKAAEVNAVSLDLALRHDMRILLADAWRLEAERARAQGHNARAEQAETACLQLREAAGYHGPERP